MGAQENVDDITPAPLEPSPEVARRPGPPESVSLERFFPLWSLFSRYYCSIFARFDCSELALVCAWRSDDDRIVAEIEAGPNRRFHEMEDRLAKLEKKMDKKVCLLPKLFLSVSLL